MSRLERWTLHLSMLLVGGTGVVYAWMRYLAEPADPYAVVNHPWQPTLQHLHVLAAPLLVFGVGIIWREHIWRHWRRGVETARRTGAGMLLTLTPMVLSGYLIQTSVTAEWRTAWIVVHLATSALWLVGYLAHTAVLERLRARARGRVRQRKRCEGAVEVGSPEAPPSPS